MTPETTVSQVRRARTRIIFGALTVLMFAASAQPQTPVDPVLIIKGAVKPELRLSSADLRAMPRVKVSAKDHDGVAREYEGVSLQAVLAKSGAPLAGDLRGKNMTLVVVAEAGDGYRAVFSLAELDADFANAQVIIADMEDGKPLDAQHGPLRLVVPGDKRQGRWVRMLKTIYVQKASESQ
jgi:DMSO/TMAO reductase YedYZ molybdopterin-dependent catalytic subunit